MVNVSYTANYIYSCSVKFKPYYLMNDFFRFTKYKLLISYLLFFAITIAASFFIYDKTKMLASPSHEQAQIRQKSYLVNGVLLNLFKIEEMSRRTIIHTNKNASEMHMIDSLVFGTNIYLDSLITITDKEHQQERLHSIKILLAQKQSNIGMLVDYIQGVSADSMYRKSMKGVLDVTKDKKERMNVVQREVVKHDTLTVKPKRKKFLQRLAEVFVPSKNDSTTQIVSSVQLKSDTIVTGEVNAKDTVQKAFKKLFLDIRAEQENARKQVLLREKKLAESNQALTNSINQILFEFEEEEIQNTLAEVEESHVILKEIVIIAILVTIIAFIIALFSLVFITRDIAKSQKYRKALEAEKLLTEKLLCSREHLILSITHDIKSPLNSILGYLEILRESNSSDSEMLSNMKSSANHILDLVNSLLDYNRLEKGIIAIKENPFNAQGLFNDIFLSFEPAAKSKNLLLNLQVSDQVDSYCGDDFRIRQITNNLLSNAIKYTEEGRVTLAIDWHMNSNSEGVLSITVSDTGRGLSEFEKESVLKEFTRLEDHKNIEGLGLGLSITQRLISLLGGTLEIESQPGKGSSFIVRLPLVAVDTVPVKQAETESYLNVPDKHLLHVLLVDDDLIQLNMVRMLLERRGYNVSVTSNPNQVLQMLQNGHFDLLISDIQMRNMSGLELVEQVRGVYPKGETGSLRIIALSGISYMTEDEFIKSGFDAMISKPVSTEKLLGIINSLLGKRSPDFDLTDLIEFAMGDREMENDLLSTFVRESELNLHALKEAFDSGNEEQLCAMAHKMKSGFKMIHADTIADSLYDVEQRRISYHANANEIKKLIIRISDLINDIKDTF